MEIEVNTGILSLNEQQAQENKQIFQENGVFVINIMGSPGAGKTTVLEKAIDLLSEAALKLAVIEGDIYTSKDAERIEKCGVPVKQINTGGACHLDAGMVARTLNSFDLKNLQLLIIENVGNLVCPVEFNLGEDVKIAVISITEGDDKPSKYPLLFRESMVVVINKIDLIEHTDVDLAAMRNDIKKINPMATIIEVSARTGEGIAEWVNWLKSCCKGKTIKSS